MSHISLSLDGALLARDYIDKGFEFAMLRWKQSVDENNEKQKQFWFSRVVHFINEMQWVDGIIIAFKQTAGHEASQ
jgi:hypothetical protein